MAEMRTSGIRAACVIWSSLLRVPLRQQQPLRTFFGSLRILHGSRPCWVCKNRLISHLLLCVVPGTPACEESQSFIAAFGRLSLWQEAISLLELKHTGQERSRGDLVMTNEAMLACSHAGKWEAVLALLSSSRAPDRISYNLAMAACCNAGEWEKVLELLSDRSDARRRADFSTYNVTITACAQGRQWERGVESLNGMLKADLQPTWVLYNLGIVLSGEGSLWRTAIDYLKDMWSRVVMPDALTYSSVVSVCEKGGQWEEAVRLVQSMRKKGLPVPWPMLYSCVGCWSLMPLSTTMTWLQLRSDCRRWSLLYEPARRQERKPSRWRHSLSMHAS